jgi:dienelactone hydrolase
MSTLERRPRRRAPVARLAGLTAAAVAVLGLGVPAAYAGGTDHPAAVSTAGWNGIAREAVTIDVGDGWTAQGELTYPRGAHGRLPVVVLLHGSGHNDMNQTLPDGAGATFTAVAQAVNRQGYAALRFNKRGVTGVGPVETTDPAQLNPPKPYERIVRDASAVVRSAARSPRVDPERIFLLGHSEGTQVAGNLAADPARWGIVKPAGVIAMGVVGADFRSLLTYQVYGRNVAALREEFDLDGDGLLTATEATNGLLGWPAEVADQFRAVLLSGPVVNPRTDRNHDGELAIDSEVAPIFRAASGIDNYPNVEGADQPLVDYALDIARFPNVSQDLPRYDGPTLLLNGQTDVQTPARAAITADAAVAAAGRKDHTLITYPGMGHTMNVTPKFTPAYADPDPVVLRDIRHWLGTHR